MVVLKAMFSRFFLISSFLFLFLFNNTNILTIGSGFAKDATNFTLN